jgi:hypothetical protein
MRPPALELAQTVWLRGSVRPAALELAQTAGLRESVRPPALAQTVPVANLPLAWAANPLARQPCS